MKDIPNPDFEISKVLVKMHNDLKNYAESPGAKMKVVQAKEFVLNLLIKNFNHLNGIIEMLNKDNRKLVYQNQYLKQQIAMNQAVLIIHGVYQFPIWLAKGWEVLQYYAVQADREKDYKIPDKFLEDLTTEERQMISDRISRQVDQKFIESLQQLPNAEKLIEKYNQLCQKV